MKKSKLSLTTGDATLKVPCSGLCKTPLQMVNNIQ